LNSATIFRIFINFFIFSSLSAIRISDNYKKKLSVEMTLALLLPPTISCELNFIWVRWKAILFIKIQKIKNPTIKILKQKLKWNCSKCTSLKNLKKLMMINNYTRPKHNKMTILFFVCFGTHNNKIHTIV
jgi:hypothetical protein